MTTQPALTVPSVRPTRSRVRVVLALTALLTMVGSIGIGTSVPAYANDPACGPLVGGIHQVSTVAHLKAVGSGGDGSGDCGLGAAYFQVNDLDVSGESSWTGIGTDSTPFTGEYNGNFKRIIGGQVWGDSFFGFFSYVGTSGTVRDVGVSNIRVTASTTLGSGNDGRGLLVGENRGTLTNTFATGSMTTTGDWYVGGLAGYSTGIIRQSFASVTISGSTTAARYVGGLVGLVGGNSVEEPGIISDSYARGSVTGNSNVGGLAGHSLSGNVSRTYAATEVTGSTHVGGLLGRDGLGTITDSYYDEDVSGQTGGAGTAQSTADMKDLGTYLNWAIVQSATPDGPAGILWGISSARNYGYPFLWWWDGPTCGPVPNLIGGEVHQVSTVAHLRAVGSGGTGTGECGLGAAYEQVSDIDASGESSWTGIGTSTAPFTGLYDGNFNQISGGQEWGSSFLGFFEYVGSAGIVRDLGVTNIRVNDSTISSDRALLVGTNKGSVSNSFATGSITTSGSRVGGLVGDNQGSIASSFASVSISAIGIRDDIGGLAGRLTTGASVTDSYATGSVSGYSKVGGLVGSSRGSITRAFSSTRPTVTFDFGFIGGLVGLDDGTLSSSYYDQTVSGLSGGPGAPKVSAAMRTANTYTGWPLVEETTPDGTTNETWGIHPSLNSGYPFLWWQEQSAFCPVLEDSVRPIRTAQQLASVGSGGLTGACSVGETYEQKNDIDLSGFGNWYPIGSQAIPFQGEYRGTGKTITNLVISGSDSYRGLFGKAASTSTISDVRVLAPNVVGDDYVGALVGWSEGSITQSEVSGTGTVTGNNWVGGLAGHIGGSTASLTRSFSTIPVSGDNTLDGRIGGLVGTLTSGGVIEDTFAAGPTTGRFAVGSLIGDLVRGTLRNSFATGEVSGTSSNINGLIGKRPTDPTTYTVTNSFYDTDLAGSPSGDVDERRTAAQLRDVSTFTGWDIVASASPSGPTGQIWGISPTKNSGYPFLWWSDYNYFCEAVEPPLVNTTQPYGTSNPYRVLIPGHLKWIAGFDLPLTANNGTLETADGTDTTTLSNRLNKSYRQDIDLNFSDCDWLPIGLVLSDQSVEYPFIGTYDGNGHAVSDLSIVGGATGDMSDITEYVGFFGRLDGTVKNLTLSSVTLRATSGKSLTYAGLLAGAAWTGAVVQDVDVEGTLSQVEDFAGGLIGEIQKVGSGTDQTRLVRCSANILMTTETGADGFHLGGLVGSLDQVPNDGLSETFTEIDDCSVTADIRSVDHRGYIGGLVGRIVAGTNTGRVMITDSISTGEIILTALGGSSSYVGGAVGLGSPVMLDVELQDVTITSTGTPEYAGGLVGQLESRGLVDDSFVTGTITTAGAGSGSVGGLVGTMSPDSDLEDSSATMTINASLSDGDLTIGGLIGFQDDDANVRTSYSSGNLGVSDPRGTTTSVGGVTGRLGDGGSLQNSWSDVNVLIDSFDGTSRVAYVGGLVGDMDAPDAEILNSYATGKPAVQGATQNLYLGEFLGRRTVDGNNTAGTITGGIHRNSNVSLDSVGNGSATGITEATEAQMEDRAFFVGRGWQIVAASTNNLPDGSSSEVWGIVDGAPCSPFLSWQASSKVQSCLVPVSSSGTTSSSAPIVAPLPPAVAPGRATPLGSADGVTEESNIQSPPSSSAESESDPQEIVTSAQGTSPLESDGGGMGWLAVLAIAGLGGVVLLGGGLAWWGSRIR